MRNNEIIRLLHILKNVKGGHVKGGCKRWPHPYERSKQLPWGSIELPWCPKELPWGFTEPWRFPGVSWSSMEFFYKQGKTQNTDLVQNSNIIQIPSPPNEKPKNERSNVIFLSPNGTIETQQPTYRIIQNNKQIEYVKGNLYFVIENTCGQIVSVFLSDICFDFWLTAMF